ncbi:MAG: YihY/virulence factor BrkB family protein, partial [Nitrospirota bacterium]|nr:YihY/virulence factor BrkB family protein [Nitrospirota bacterium]
ENALNLIFKIQKMRSIFRSFILSFSVVTLIIIMILFSFTASSFIPLLKALKPIFPELRIGMITSFLIAYVVPFFMVLFTITMLYILLPKTRVRLPHALIGALFATSLQEVAKHLFTWYVGSFVKFGTIYGSLTTFVVFLLWVYYSTCIFLIGAEIVHNQETGRRGYGG